MQENQHMRKLREAIAGYFENDHISEIKKAEYEKYLKLRIRPLMELLIEQEDLDKMETVAKNGWFLPEQIDSFIKTAGERHCLSAFVWLLNLKKEICGFNDKDFLL